jgi:hypothetical protein
MTARHLVESARPISEGTQNPQLKTRRNTAKIVVGLTVVFLISYLPYHAIWIYIICTAEKLYYSEKYGVPFFRSSDFPDVNLLLSFDELRYMYIVSTWFLLISSCLNPVALFCTSSPFRQHLKRYLTCFCKTNSAPPDFKLTRRH